MNFMHVPRSAAASHEPLLAASDAALGLRTLKTHKVLRSQHLTALAGGTKEMAQRLLKFRHDCDACV
jgi:hypothetical protein